MSTTSTSTSTSTYAVAGMTCGHCVSAVTEEISALPGVTNVAVDLVAGAISSVSVTSDAELDREQVAEAVDEAGYELVGTP
jgi:copper chaperone